VAGVNIRRTLDKVLEVRALGVTRRGASATAAMPDEARQRLGLKPVEVAKSVVAGQWGTPVIGTRGAITSPPADLA